MMGGEEEGEEREEDAVRLGFEQRESERQGSSETQSVAVSAGRGGGGQQREEDGGRGGRESGQRPTITS